MAPPLPPFCLGIPNTSEMTNPNTSFNTILGMGQEEDEEEEQKGRCLNIISKCRYPFFGGRPFLALSVVDAVLSATVVSLINSHRVQFNRNFFTTNDYLYLIHPFRQHVTK